MKFKTRYPLEIEMSDNFKNELFEVEIKDNSNAIGHHIFQLDFPKTSLIVLISRNGQYITPTGTTTIEKGDRLLIMSDSKKDIDLINQFIDPAKKQ